MSLIKNIYLKDSEHLKVPYLSYVVLLILPIFTVPLIVLLLAYSKTQDFTLIILKENNIVEMLTFVFLLLASIIGFRMLYRVFKSIKLYLWILMFIFVLLVFMVAMEEIAWGQQFFSFATPEKFKALNAQQELTLHNLNELQGKSEYFRLIFGVGGLIAFLLCKNRYLKILEPPKILISFLLVITIVTLVDLFADYYPIKYDYEYGLQRLSEFIEMLIGIVSLRYIIFLNNKLKSQ